MEAGGGVKGLGNRGNKKLTKKDSGRVEIGIPYPPLRTLKSGWNRIKDEIWMQSEEKRARVEVSLNYLKLINSSILHFFLFQNIKVDVDIRWKMKQIRFWSENWNLIETNKKALIKGMGNNSIPGRVSYSGDKKKKKKKKKKDKEKV